MGVVLGSQDRQWTLLSPPQWGGWMVTTSSGAAFGLRRSSGRALAAVAGTAWTEVGVEAQRLGLMRKKNPWDPSVARGGDLVAARGCGTEVAESRGIRSPQAFIVRLSHFLWLYCFCPTPYCLVSFCPSFQPHCLLFSSQPGCFHFFCLKFLRGRFYFQRFD